MDASVIMTTVSSRDEAEALGSGLVAARLAACVQEVTIESRYRWKGEVHCDPEVLLLIKTARDRARQVVAHLEQTHPYDVPEILVLDASGGATGYLGWLEAETRG